MNVGIIPGDMSLTQPLSSGWMEGDNSGSVKYYTWIGNRGEPVNGAVFTNKIHFREVEPNTTIANEIILELFDYGGRGGRMNTLYKSVNIEIVGAGPTEVVPLF